MNDVELILDADQQGRFVITEGGEQLGEMEIKIKDAVLTAIHTEVAEAAEGKGLGKKLFSAMVDYARQNKLSVYPLCPFVHSQLKRHAADYADIWTKGNEG